MGQETGFLVAGWSGSVLCPRPVCVGRSLVYNTLRNGSRCAVRSLGSRRSCDVERLRHHLCSRSRDSRTRCRCQALHRQTPRRLFFNQSVESASDLVETSETGCSRMRRCSSLRVSPASRTAPVSAVFQSRYPTIVITPSTSRQSSLYCGACKRGRCSTRLRGSSRWCARTRRCRAHPLCAQSRREL